MSRRVISFVIAMAPMARLSLGASQSVGFSVDKSRRTAPTAYQPTPEGDCLGKPAQWSKVMQKRAPCSTVAGARGPVSGPASFAWLSSDFGPLSVRYCMALLTAIDFVQRYARRDRRSSHHLCDGRKNALVVLGFDDMVRC
jgi:hypothetical protein